jgi:hypothetical protein
MSPHSLSIRIAGLLLALGPLQAPCQETTFFAGPPQGTLAEEPERPPQPGAGDFAFLGLATRAQTPGAEASGIVVLQVYPGSSAEGMGFKVGDEILTVNDFLVGGRKAFIEELKRANVGARMRFLVRRDGKTQTLSGRIGSYRKSMAAYQRHLRKKYEGQLLPPLPEAFWWNEKESRWEDGPEDWRSLRGKLVVVVSFDDCETCRKARIEKISLMKQGFAQVPSRTPLEFVGVYYRESPDSWGRKANQKGAEALLKEMRPSFPVTVAAYPDDSPTPEMRARQFLIHHHGIAILDPQGKVRFLQILGLPGAEFAQAYKKLLEEFQTEDEKPAGGKPPEERDEE